MKNLLLILLFSITAFQMNAGENGNMNELCDMPIASFTTSFYANLQADFDSYSSTNGANPTYAWDFGDGNTDTGNSPSFFSHSYAAAGTYNVCLTITNDCGSDQYCENITIASCVNPTAEFYGNPNASVGDPIYLSSVSSHDPDNGMLNSLWDFGDGNTSTDEFPNHSYTSAGTYSICLTITDNCGSDTYCSVMTVTGGCNMPVADFYPGDTTYDGLTVNFSDVSTSDTGGSLLWDFGDGNTSTDGFPVHTYAATGTYTVCLTITDACGTDTVCKTLTITNSSGCNMPVADFYPGDTTYDGLTVNFSDVSTSDTGGSLLWDFGDGNTSTDGFPVHTYAATGTYTVCLTITDACGTDTACKTLTITNSSACNMPVADFYPGDQTYEGLQVYFSNVSTSDTGGSLLWDFGDGNTSTDEFPVHTYAAAGTYTVCLTITDACGTDTVCKTLTITTPCVAVAPENQGTNAISSTTTQVYWDEVSGATFYQVKYKLLGTSTWSTRGTAALQRNLPGLTPNKYYQYKVRSQCDNGTWSDFTSIEIFYSSTCQAPTGVASVYLDETRVRIRWDADPAVEKNKVKYREAGTSSWIVQGSTPGNNYLYINGLTPSTTYEYRVRAKCSGNDWSAYSDLLTFSTDAMGSRIAPENEAFSLAIFPNPVNDLLNIQYESATKGNMQITITDIVGKTIYSQNQDCEKGMNKQEINVNHLVKGYYIINIQNGNDLQSMKFIKN